jgi:hypothetical protein
MKRRAGLLAVFIFWCAVLAKGENLVASISDQEIALLDRGKVLARCPISTSKFGPRRGDRPLSHADGRSRAAAARFSPCRTAEPARAL